jgi:predicted membrane protein
MTNQERITSGPGPIAAVVAFAVFLALLVGSYKAMENRPDAGWSPGQDTNHSSSASRIDSVAVMSETRQLSDSPDFERAEVTAVMGHGVLDLRKAEIQGEAVVECLVFMGQATIRVPEDWTVVTKEVVLMGGTHNRTRKEAADPAKRLRIDGLVLMGGLVVTH